MGEITLDLQEVQEEWGGTGQWPMESSSPQPQNTLRSAVARRWSRFAESGSNVANCGGRPRLPSFMLLGSSRARKQRPGAPPRRWEINDFRIINAPKPFNFPRLNFVQQTSRSPGVETGIARL